MSTTCIEIFIACTKAVRHGELIRRVSKSDKEFHFQNWFGKRLDNLGLKFDAPERNTYPDFRLVQVAEGYETKGLGYPGREANYDCNSQVPSGEHNGRTIFYVFGRYPADPDSDDYPVLDLVVCHGDFLNAHHNYKHKNESFTAFGSYGDIMIRDRKMYVAPTPFGLTEGTARHSTLILPVGFNSDKRLKKVGDLVRIEADKLVAGYTFNMATNKLTPSFMPNPTAGKEHTFVAFRLIDSDGPSVSMSTRSINHHELDD